MGATPTTHHYPLWHGPPYREPAVRIAGRGLTRARAKPRPLGPRELGAAVALLVVADLALWSAEGLASGGLGFAAFFIGVPALLFVAIRSWKASIRLGVLIGLLLLVVARVVYRPTPLTIGCGLGLVVGFALALRGRRVFVPMMLVAVLGVATTLPSRVGAAFAGLTSIGRRTRVGRVSVLPVVVPIALVGLFAGTFALANPIIARGLGAVWSLLSGCAFFPSVGRFVFWTMSLTLGVALLRPAYRLATASEVAPDHGIARPASLLIARNALVGLNGLFLVETVLDARYLWLGSPPLGMSTQQYAHEGAFWLTLALVMLTVVVGLMFRGPLANDPRAARIRVLAQAWMAQGLVLAAGTYRRIGIHVAHSGLSDLRIVGILGTTLVVIGVVFVGWKLRNQKTFAWLVRRQLDALALMLVVYASAPTHLLSARVNVSRLLAGELPPAIHVFRQSKETESVAELLPLLDHPDARVREGVAALLDDARTRLRADVARQQSWKQRDLASARALAALDESAVRIAGALGTTPTAEAKDTLLDLVHDVNGAPSERARRERAVPTEAAADAVRNEAGPGRPDARPCHPKGNGTLPPKVAPSSSAS